MYNFGAAPGQQVNQMSGSPFDSANFGQQQQGPFPFSGGGASPALDGGAPAFDIGPPPFDPSISAGLGTGGQTPGGGGGAGGYGSNFNFNDVLSGLGGLAGTYGDFQNGRNQNTSIRQAQNSGQLSPMGLNNAGGSASVAPGQLNSTVSPGQQQLFNGSTAFSNNAIGQAGNQMGQQPTQQLGQNNELAQAGVNQLNNGITGAANSAALNQLGQANQNFGSVYQGSLNNIMSGLQPGRNQQIASANDAQFQRGQMGTSGGALQSRAMYQGFGQTDLAAQQQAYGQALQQQQQNVNSATAYGNLGNNNLMTGTGLLNSAFNNFNNLSALPGNLAGQSMNLAQGGQGISNNVNQLGLNNLDRTLKASDSNSQLMNNAAYYGGRLAQNQTNQGGNVLGGALDAFGRSSGGSQSPWDKIIGGIGGLFGRGGGAGGGAGGGVGGILSSIGGLFGSGGGGGNPQDPNAGFDPNAALNWPGVDQSGGAPGSGVYAQDPNAPPFDALAPIDWGGGGGGGSPGSGVYAPDPNAPTSSNDPLAGNYDPFAPPP